MGYCKMMNLALYIAIPVFATRTLARKMKKNRENMAKQNLGSLRWDVEFGM